MAKLVVSLAWPIGDERKARLRALSPDLEVRDVTDLVRREYRLSQPGGDPAELATARRELDAALQDTHVFFCRDAPADLPRRAPNLRWLQFMTAGLDRRLTQEFLAHPAVLASGQGVASHAIAEFAVLMMLQHVKRLQRVLELQRERRWDRRGVVMTELRGKTVGIVGLGHIGREVAQFARAFDMRILATRRSATAVLRDAEGVDVLYPASRLHEMLPQVDFLVLSLPLTPETEGIIGAKELALLKPTAYLINVARGRVLDHAALERALQEERLAGAALDVFPEEPLPPHAPHWVYPRTIVSPHASSNVDTYMDNAIALFMENLDRFLKGQPLVNLVDKEKGAAE